MGLTSVQSNDYDGCVVIKVLRCFRVEIAPTKENIGDASPVETLSLRSEAELDVIICV